MAQSDHKHNLANLRVHESQVYHLYVYVTGSSWGNAGIRIHGIHKEGGMAQTCSATQLQPTGCVNYFSSSPEQTHATEYRMN